MRSAYLATQWMTWLVIVPLSLASLASGLIQSLGTRWGLLRHYRVLIKLAITLLAIVVLLVHARPIDQLAEAAASLEPIGIGLRAPQVLMVTAATAALLALAVAAILSVYKPRGRTPYGWRKH